MNFKKQLENLSKEELINEVIKRESLLGHFFRSKYHKLRIILFYIKRFLYLTVFFDFLGRYKDKVRINTGVIKQSKKNNDAIKVLYDFQTFTAQKVGGISRLFFELISHFAGSKDISVDLALRYSENFYLKNTKLIKDKRIFTRVPPLRHFTEFFPPAPFNEDSLLINFYRKFFLKLKSLKYLSWPGVSFASLKPYDYYIHYDANLKTAINFLKKGDFDIFHPTYYDTYFLKYLKNKPFVLTIYDMIHEKFPECHHSNDIISKQKKFLAKKAAKVIAISEQTKKDIVEILKIPEEKIVVIPLASSFKEKAPEIKLKNLPKKYLLYVGQRVGYKNFNFFVKSISDILRKDKNLYLVCTGDFPSSGPFTTEEKEMFNQLKISKKVLYFKADDKTLQYLYSKAYAFVFPTLYEGFGIPILEAYSLGCPVLCSDIPVFKEITGEDGAIHFNPRNKKSIQNAVKLILQNKNLRNSLIKKGYEINKKYSWKKTATLTKSVYEEVLKKYELY
jgi:glycosyltransferase involved in cell wall biosynthesis